MMKKPLYALLLLALFSACGTENGEIDAENNIVSDTETTINSKQPVPDEAKHDPADLKSDQSSSRQSEIREQPKSQDYTYQYDREANTDQSNSEDLIVYGNTRDLLKSLAAPAQLFDIPSDTNIIIVGKEGTEIGIKSHSFIFEDGTEPTGPITFALKECYDYDDMLYENLTTMSKGQLLETGGMIHLAATSNGKKLALREHTELEVRFPQELEDDMQIFYENRKEDGEMDWELDELARIPYPILRMTFGRFGHNVYTFFAEDYKIDKEEMLALVAKSWMYEVSFDAKGKESL